jgi:hypothetical protein
MFEKLRTFQDCRGKGTVDSAWTRRFRFSIKQKDREKSLAMVDRWNEKLKDLAAGLDRSRDAVVVPAKM